ncbi:hypothetical protein [Cystobacter fuscus]|uniref:hypothetical protein n=1 Tax=Cystobacter fuscus TaxID=43 RepID=UPI0037C0E3DB
MPEKTVVPLLDVLMNLRADMKSRSTGPYAYIGMPDVERLTGLISGYLQCLLALKVEVGTDALFRDWMRDVKQALPGQGWGSVYLEEFQGDAKRAIQKYLDFVAEFRGLSSQELAALDWPSGGPHPTARTPRWTLPPSSKRTLDLLLEVREVIGDTPGRLGLFIGLIDVRRMAGFIDGYRLCLALAGARDEEYSRFERWLHDEKGLPAGQEWSQHLLQARHGDDEQAIRHLLELAAEFRARSSPPG